MLVAPVGSANNADPLPAPEELPDNVIALVSHVSSEVGTITKREFRHALAQQAASAGQDSTPEPGEKGYERLKVRAVSARLETAWIQGQAAAMRIKVTARQVARELAQIKKENFKNGAEYRKFLSEYHLTRRDVKERVKVQLISTRIQRRIALSPAGQADADKAFKDFVAAYRKRWRGRTVCAPDYVTEECSNGPLPIDNAGAAAAPLTRSSYGFRVA
jgi:hypothetical protein